ncbi:hypothetical protein MPSEU_000835100 [Mayamaea pseudoterrestris]|nr:hypothetical protein MPSEU_000835100 [Mayamaea pseudoterrestris]
MVVIEDMKMEEMATPTEASSRETLVVYLMAIRSAATRLATRPTSNDGVQDMDVEEAQMKTDTTLEDPALMMEQIALLLLDASHLSILSAPITNLPDLPIIWGSHGEAAFRDYLNEDLLYKYRRIDYLRMLLRSTAPIAIDLAASICHYVQKQLEQASEENTQQSKQKANTTLAAFVLFSQWLPFASHLVPIVSDLFALQAFQSPLMLVETLIQTSSAAASMNDDDYNQQEQLDYDYKHLVIEAAYHICELYSERREHFVMKEFWQWESVFAWFASDGPASDDAVMSDNELQLDNEQEAGDAISNGGEDDMTNVDPIRWYAVRVAARVLKLSASVCCKYFKLHKAHQEFVPGMMIHPFDLDHEYCHTQSLALRGLAQFWRLGELTLPTLAAVRRYVPLHHCLVDLGKGLVFYKHGAIRNNSSQHLSAESGKQQSASQKRRLVMTPTTADNLSNIGVAMCLKEPPPILVSGPRGSGKSSLVRELARLFCNDDETYNHDAHLLEIHVDDETDTKTLIGSYTTSDIPGEFEWRPGALTIAVRTGQWVLMEDIDGVPQEIQASLVQLLESRLLPLGNGKVERCHPNFRLFGTITPFSGNADASRRTKRDRTVGGKRLLNPDLWRVVDIRPLPASELKNICVGLYPSIPESIVDSVMKVFQAIDPSGRAQIYEIDDTASRIRIDRPPSVRDLFKVFSRIRRAVAFERWTQYVTEAQRTLCFAEAVDVFIAASPDPEMRRNFVRHIAAPSFAITADLGFRYVETRCPTLDVHDTCTAIGRVNLEVPRNALRRAHASTFATTEYTLRLMEAIGVCVQETEPVLLVGETGCGKTTVLQQLAALCGRELTVQNFSLQTDSNDILGGYRPLELRLIAAKLYNDFVDLFVSIFSRKQNAEFLQFAHEALKKQNWKNLSHCYQRAAGLGMGKVRRGNVDAANHAHLNAWMDFHARVEKFEQQRLAADAGLAFVFTEGALVDAVRTGKWILLDEINLASSENLMRICGLLDDPFGSLTLTEKGDTVPLERHPDFRLFAAMNPATDAGKRDLNATIRSRFTEIYVTEIMDPVELRTISVRYIADILPKTEAQLQHSDMVIAMVDVYLSLRSLADTSLVDGSGQRPRYTLRTLTRALTAARALVKHQKLPLRRAIYEGFELAFEGPLDAASTKSMRKVLRTGLKVDFNADQVDQPSRRPGKDDEHELIAPFWLKTGPLGRADWSTMSAVRHRMFVLTPSTRANLRRLSRVVAAGPWPVLLEGPTSAGKTTLIEYLGARLGHPVTRINNHEHTDVQEYLGSFIASSTGSLLFRDGLLVRALRLGEWVILDELNLAPTEVLEALNRLLDDNRELYIPETNEVIVPHEGFRLFATQNPSGAYGGRKQLSRAFRNRFVELHMGDIASSEMAQILVEKCSCAPSQADLLVAVMDRLRLRRRKSGVFLGKDGFITPRDLLRWANRKAASKHELAREGYMLLAERLRTLDEKQCVKEEIERVMKVQIEIDKVYSDKTSKPYRLLQTTVESSNDDFIGNIAITKSLKRLVALVARCIEHNEPVLLVGDTGCGKTTVIQLLSIAFAKKLHTISCHATTETADLLGGLRPVRGRALLFNQMIHKGKKLLSVFSPDDDIMTEISIPLILRQVGQVIETSDQATDSQSTLVRDIAQFVQQITVFQSSRGGHREKKRIKLDSGNASPSSETTEIRGRDMDTTMAIVDEIHELISRYNSLFEWSDGPLVEAMKQGDFLLLDEISLAEDAVLERLNSVLEPSQSLVLAEKGADVSENPTITAVVGFHVFATMNPGGDFGKRELSPALRNRFTEIWVPSIDNWSDIDIVLKQALKSVDSEFPLVHPHMLDYVRHFNDYLCGPLHFALALSLRDMLSWAGFMVTTLSGNESQFGCWDAYQHGASMMHLDGLGLGTGMSTDGAAELKGKAESYLRDQIQAYVNGLPDDKSGAVGISRGGFGLAPFYVKLGPCLRGTPSFLFETPTTSANCLRILRALQLPKPILLEGSPGVGKTTIVHALAAASGHRLVRINLSEQTDLADLIGQDLPSPAAEEETSMLSFQWFDGVLLAAIKAGDWVLLDEINLAQQAVLEGLNSCLDHRASIFIPELGREIACPTTFRVFAAQNPVAQGGGRKGLPKSFLNRFTKVYMDQLTDDDMRQIAISKFPCIGTAVLNKMIKFGNHVHGAVEARVIGQLGSPWEVNLRDLFRWGELLSDVSCANESDCTRFAWELYIHRFRTRQDRDFISSRYKSVFGNDIIREVPMIEITASHVSVGSSKLNRNADQAIRLDSDAPDAQIPYIIRDSLEAAARCVLMDWPCLLISSHERRASNIVNSLAAFTGCTVVEVALSSSSDISELIGGFEQVVETTQVRDMLITARRLAYEYMLTVSSAQVGWLLSKVSLDASDATIDAAIELVAILFRNKSIAKSNGVELKRIEHSLKAFRQRTLQRCTSKGVFSWTDGPLTRAMIDGHWIHLRGSNLCPATVLDRLNSICEPDGSLLVAECGSERIIKRHARFRVFLSYNPDAGEISKAMRNRCVELFLDIEPNPCLVDVYDRIWHSGLRDNAAVSALVDNYKSFEPSQEPADYINDVGLVAAFFCERGCGPDAHVQLSSLPQRPIGSGGCNSLASATSLLRFPSVARVLEDARLIRYLATWAGELPQLHPLDTKRFDALGYKTARCPLGELYDRISPLLPADLDVLLLRDILLLLMVGRSSLNDVQTKALMLGSIQSAFGGVASFLTSQAVRISATATDGVVGSKVDNQYILTRTILSSLEQQLETLRFHRLPQQALEARDTECIIHLPLQKINQMSVLSASILISRGALDKSVLGCSLTALYYPFLKAFDEAMSLLKIGALGEKQLQKIQNLFSQRDQLWHVGKDTLIDQSRPGMFLFDEAEIVLQWTACRRYLQSFGLLVNLEFRDDEKKWNRLETIVDAIDGAIYGSLGKTTFCILDTAIKPLVPQTTESWSIILSLKRLANSYSLDYWLLGEKSLRLDDLLAQRHPYLFVSSGLKRDLMTALSTIYLAGTSHISTSSNFSFGRIGTKAMVDLVQQWDDAASSFGCMLNSILVDPNIETPENAIAIADFPKHGQCNNLHLVHVESHLLQRFADLQLTPLAEFYSELVERNYVREISRLLLADDNIDWTQLKNLIGFATGHTRWNVELHQMLVWASEIGDKQLMSRLLLSLSCASVRRSWSGASWLFDRITWDLRLPSPVATRCEESASASQRPLTSSIDRASIPIATVYRLLRNEFRCLTLSNKGGNFGTIENYETRGKQANTLMQMLCSLDIVESRDGPWEINMQVVDTFSAIRDNVPQEELDMLIQALSCPEGLLAIQVDCIPGMMQIFGSVMPAQQLNSVLIPLLKCLKGLWATANASNNTSLDYGKARVYLGVFRFHLLIPDSPLDPCRKPQAAVSTIDRQLQQLRTNLSAIRLDGIFTKCNHSPDYGISRQLLDEGDRLMSQRNVEEQKMFQRPAIAPPFQKLFQEIRDFAEQVLCAEKVLLLLDDSVKLLEPPSDRLQHFEITAVAFCRRLIDQYSIYEDVVIPLLDAIGSVLIGFKVVADVHARRSASLGSLLASLSSFPMIDSKEDYHDVNTTYRHSVGVARLARCGILSKAGDIQALTSWYGIVDGIVESCHTFEIGCSKSDSNPVATEDDYKEHFPDFREDYQPVQAIDDDDQHAEIVYERTTPPPALLRDEHICIMSNIHESVFMCDYISDAMRIEAFRLSFEASCEIFETPGTNISSESFVPASGYAMALSLFNLQEKYAVDALQQQSSSPDFYRAANPIESSRAAPVLTMLMGRLTALHTAFPDNEVLLAVISVTEQIRKFDLYSVPLAKVMVGLELILKHAQDWEQHASRRVKIGEPLTSLRHLVSSWRKLQLQCWSLLLDSRQEAFNRRARLHWASIHMMLRPSALPPAPATSLTFLTPLWVLRYHGRAAKQSRPEVAAIIKTLDTFILTSSLGEFFQRLRIIECFARQLQTEERHQLLDDIRVALARSVRSLFVYYNQFVPCIKNKLDKLHQPIEVKLADEVKLAKWDEQSYYAAVDAAERNYKSLMRLIKEYDEVLHLPVTQMLEQELCRGVGDDQEDASAVTKIPARSILFSALQVEGALKNNRKLFVPEITKLSETIPEACDGGMQLVADEKCFAAQIKQYIKRMYTFRREAISNSMYSSTHEASDLNATIFERIDSLRSDKVTRPMKERALIDLLKELKHQGYAESKYSTPIQVSSLSELFQLPTMTFYNDLDGMADLSVLQSAEMYYQRVLAEMDRFRGEVCLIGSRHLTQRQTNLMLALSDSGLYMLVRLRCTLSINMTACGQMRKLTENLACCKTIIPVGQKVLTSKVGRFNRQSNELLENLRQHKLLLARTKYLFAEDDKAALADELARQLDAAILKQKDHLCAASIITTEDHLHQLTQELDSLIAFRDFLQKHLEKCKGLLPIDAIRDTLALVYKSINAAESCTSVTANESPPSSQSDPHDLVNCVSLAVEAALLSVQPLVARRDANDSSTSSIWHHHQSFVETSAKSNIMSMIGKVNTVICTLQGVIDNQEQNVSIIPVCVKLCADLSVLLGLTVDLFDEFLRETISFYRVTAKLQYIILRVFRVLVAKGFCSDDVDEKEPEGEGTDGLNFEEKDGTGMGDGDGKKDVTDQIEDEEQLLGLKGDEEEGQQQDESRELDKEEAEKGMEMTNEFDGEIFDVPETENGDDPNNDDEEGEELDREMGDGEGQNDRVVDERMWNESDDEEEGTEEQKFEKGSTVQGGEKSDEMATKDDEEKDAATDNKSGEAPDSERADIEDNGKSGDDAINEDLDEQYEESHGVPVRQEEDDKDEGLEIADDMELDEADDQKSETGDNIDDADNSENDNESIHGEPDVNMLPDLTADEEKNDDEKPQDETESSCNAATAAAQEEHGLPEEDKADEADPEREPELRVENDKSEPQHGLGVQSQEGKDVIDHCLDDDKDGQGENDGEQTNDNEGAGDSETNPSGKSDGGGSGSQGQNVSNGVDAEAKRSKVENEVPNPLKHPGDASKYWHRKLNLVEPQNPESEKQETDDLEVGEKQAEHNGDFEFGNDNDSLQALAEVNDDDVASGERNEQHNFSSPPELTDHKAEEAKQDQSQNRQSSRPSTRPSNARQEHTEAMDEDEELESTIEHADELTDNEDEANEMEDSPYDPIDAVGNVVVSDTSQLQQEELDATVQKLNIKGEESQLAGLTAAEESVARRHWNELQLETYALSRRLCEKLRLVMEPLVASKLRGDYRTGKRINMKRVIGYIASGYRKDKIWLRRTKPAKRNYRVLIAVDDSESMRKTGAGEMALKALATLTTGMSQLEIGEIGVASFGNEMNLIHSFDQPFTSESGPNIVGNFRFEQQRTRTALCVESAMMALESHGSQVAPMQLVFMISDGRIERDSRTALRRLNRELTERNILMVMMIVEGENKKDSILNMKEVTFDKGKPIVKSFMDDYPFPYYIVLEDMQSLPEVLGDALRQWFEMLAGLQGNN